MKLIKNLLKYKMMSIALLLQTCAHSVEAQYTQQAPIRPNQRYLDQLLEDFMNQLQVTEAYNLDIAKQNFFQHTDINGNHKSFQKQGFSCIIGLFLYEENPDTVKSLTVIKPVLWNPQNSTNYFTDIQFNQFLDKAFQEEKNNSKILNCKFVTPPKWQGKYPADIVLSNESTPHFLGMNKTEFNVMYTHFLNTAEFAFGGLLSDELNSSDITQKLSKII